MIERIDVGQRIRELRKLLALSARELSEATGGEITRNSISDLESGRTKTLSVWAALSLARCFGITVEQLLDKNFCIEAYAIARNYSPDEIDQALQMARQRSGS